MPEKVRLPKPAGSATNEQLKLYINAHLEGGDKRVLAEEVLRLRALIVSNVAVAQPDDKLCAVYEKMILPVVEKRQTVSVGASDDELL